MQMITSFLKDTQNCQRLFVLTFIVYYLFRLEPYTWYYAEQLLQWPPSSLLQFDAIWINRNFTIILFSWIFTGVWYLVKPRLYSGAIFFLLSYMVVGRLNSYVFILRYDFSPMAFLLLTIMLPKGDEKEDRKLKDIIVFMAKLVWVSLFFTAAIAKFESKLDWFDSYVLKDFVYYENLLQGPAICDDPTRIGIVNYFMGNDLLVTATAIIVLIFELFYPLALFSKRMAMIFLGISVIFQVSIDYLMWISFYNYWVGVMFWFMPEYSKSEEH